MISQNVREGFTESLQHSSLEDSHQKHLKRKRVVSFTYYFWIKYFKLQSNICISFFLGMYHQFSYFFISLNYHQKLDQ